MLIQYWLVSGFLIGSLGPGTQLVWPFRVEAEQAYVNFRVLRANNRVCVISQNIG
jgi:hypothetical protein